MALLWLAGGGAYGPAPWGKGRRRKEGESEN